MKNKKQPTVIFERKFNKLLLLHRLFKSTIGNNHRQTLKKKTISVSKH